MKLAIIDDQPYYLEDIKKRIDEYKQTSQDELIVHEFTDPKKFLEYFHIHLYDLIYIDIEMKEYDGLEIARTVKEEKPNCMIIFVTSHLEYLNHSFIVEPFQYFIKPIQNNEMFINELQRAIQQYKSYNKSVIFNTNNGTKKVGLHDIIYFETSYKEYSVHTTKGSIYGSLKSMKNIKQELEDRFFYKIQRSYIVNLSHIASVDGYFVTMDNGISLPISRKYIKDFKNSYYRFLEYCS